MPKKRRGPRRLSPKEMNEIEATMKILHDTLMPRLEKFLAAAQCKAPKLGDDATAIEITGNTPLPVFRNNAIDEEAAFEKASRTEEALQEIDDWLRPLVEAIEEQALHSEYRAYQDALKIYEHIGAVAAEKKTPELIAMYEELTKLLPDQPPAANGKSGN